MNFPSSRCMLIAFFLLAGFGAHAQQVSRSNAYIQFMEKSAAHARKFGSPVPTLSPVDQSILPTTNTQGPLVPVEELHRLGIRVVPWTTNDPERMRALIRSGVDGIISDRPDILQQILREAREKGTQEEREHLEHFDIAAHRGGRGLRPENTLPSFESGLDQLSTTLETDTGVSADHVSTIWHDQFYNPESCRHADGTSYTMENRVYLRDISSTDAQKIFVCDKVHFGPDQKNDLSLSPVAVAFATKEGLQNPYVPTYVDQLFRFVRFYAEYYRIGPGKSIPHAVERANNAENVRFNIETKILPELKLTSKESALAPSAAAQYQNHTVGPELFVSTLAGTIERYRMEMRSEIQSFDFRTLLLTEQQHPKIPTYYLTGDPASLSTDLVPESLRVDVSKP
jgi:glycerophosphoryl diester phosphodiesterase